MKIIVKKALMSGVLSVLALAPLLPLSAYAAGLTVTTNSASGITTTAATISGNYDTNGAPGGADSQFDWGQTPSLGNTTTFTHQSGSTGSFSETLSGLAPGTKYYFRAMANNTTTGPAYGALLSFTTAGNNAPTVSTMSETHTTTTATLVGFYNSNGTNPTDTQFLWGTSPSSLPNATGFVSRSATSGTFTATLTGLTPATRYYFRAVAQNAAGSTLASQILPFTTTATTPSCVINSFTATPTTVSSGGVAALAWNTSNCVSASIDNGIGSVTPVANGSVSTGAVSTTTTYTLTAVSSTGATTTASVTVTVNGTSGGSSCVITSFSSNSPITYGSNGILYWNTTGCTSLAISGVGAVATGSGQTSVGTLSASTTYTLSGTDTSGRTTTAQTMLLVTTGNGGGGGSTCTINSFSPMNSGIQSGASTVLSWNTSGCNYVTISGGQLGTSQNSASGQISTGVLSGTTTFTLYAFGSNGSNSVSQTATVYVTGGPYAYTYACSDNTDNDGDGRIDFPNDPGCGSQYDNDEADTNTITSGATNIITTPANNISSQTARLNGILTNTEYQANAYFEYGLSADALTHATAPQVVSGGSTINFSDTIQVVPGTTYFYRAAAQTNRTSIRGSISSFVTPGATSTPVTYVGGSSWSTYYGGGSTTKTSNTTTSTTGSGTVASMLTITNKGDKVAIGDTVDYIITYTNTTGKTLRDAVLTIVLPQGFTAKQASQGKLASFNTVEVALGTLTPGQSGSVFLQATVDQNTPIGETLVTTATLSYTLPNGQHDSGVGYVLNHASGSATLGGFALGSGFFPTTIFGWIMTIIIILVLILLARRITRGKAAGHGAHH